MPAYMEFQLQNVQNAHQPLYVELENVQITSYQLGVLDNDPAPTASLEDLVVTKEFDSSSPKLAEYGDGFFDFKATANDEAAGTLASATDLIIDPFNPVRLDSGDLASWQANYGTTGSESKDGDVDGRDFLAWQRNVGSDTSQPNDLTGDGSARPLEVKLEPVLITSYQLGVLDNDAATDGDHHVDAKDFLAWHQGPSPSQPDSVVRPDAFHSDTHHAATNDGPSSEPEDPATYPEDGVCEPPVDVVPVDSFTLNFEEIDLFVPDGDSLFGVKATEGTEASGVFIADSFSFGAELEALDLAVWQANYGAGI